MRIYGIKLHFILRVLIIISLTGLLLSACQNDRPEQTTKPEANSAKPGQSEQVKQTENKPETAAQGCPPLNEKPPAGDKLFVKSSHLYIVNGEIMVYDLQVDKFKIKPGMRFDLLGENGYLARVCAAKELPEENSWQLEIVPGSMRPDLKELDKGEGIEAFLIYPSRAERSTIRIKSKPDLRAIFTTLPGEVQKWHNIALKTMGYKEGISQFTDLDGDGVIDLIDIEGPCDGTANDDLTCSKILRLVNKQWKQVAFITPA